MKKTNETNNATEITMPTPTDIRAVFTGTDFAKTAEIERKDKDGNSKLAYVQDFTLYGKHKGKDSLRLTDKELIESTNRVLYAKGTGELIGRVLCRELYKINEKATFKSVGFKSITEYASKLFDLSNSSVKQYVRIGHWFLTDDYKDISIFTETLTISHMLELLTLVDEESENPLSKIEEMFADGILNDTMSTAKMRQAIKKEKGVVEGESKEKSDSRSKKKSNGADTNDEPQSDIEKAVITARYLEELLASYEKDVSQDTLEAVMSVSKWLASWN